MASPSCKWQECQTLSQTPSAPSLTPSLGMQAHEVQLLEHQAPPPRNNLDLLPLHPEHGSRCIMNRQLSCFFFGGGGVLRDGMKHWVWNCFLILAVQLSGCFLGFAGGVFFLSNNQDKTRTFGVHDAQRRTMIAEVLPSIEELGLTQDCNMGKIRPRKQHLSNIFLALFLCLIRTLHASVICHAMLQHEQSKLTWLGISIRSNTSLIFTQSDLEMLFFTSNIREGITETTRDGGSALHRR